MLPAKGCGVVLTLPFHVVPAVSLFAVLLAREGSFEISCMMPGALLSSASSEPLRDCGCAGADCVALTAGVDCFDDILVENDPAE